MLDTVAAIFVDASSSVDIVLVRRIHTGFFTNWFYRDKRYEENA